MRDFPRGAGKSCGGRRCDSAVHFDFVTPVSESVAGAGDDIRQNPRKRMQVPSVAHPCLEIAETWRWDLGSLGLWEGLAGLGCGLT